MDNLEYVQKKLVNLAVDKAGYEAAAGMVAERVGNEERREQLLMRVDEVQEEIDDYARRLVELKGWVRKTSAEGEKLEIRPIANETLAMYFVDSNIPIGILIMAPTAAVAEVAVSRIVDRARDGDGGHSPKISKMLKPFVNGREVKINNVYYVCDLVEAVQNG